jgi:hypothetical protein
MSAADLLMVAAAVLFVMHWVGVWDDDHDD